MLEYELVLQQFKKLNDTSKKFVINQLLLDGDIDFVEISNAYVAVLEAQNDAEKEEVADSVVALALAWREFKEPYTRKLAAQRIVSSGTLAGSPIFKECMDYLEGKTSEH